jgi:hypothetical protein
VYRYLQCRACKQLVEPPCHCQDKMCYRCNQVIDAAQPYMVSGIAHYFHSLCYLVHHGLNVAPPDTPLEDFEQGIYELIAEMKRKRNR